MKTCFFFGLIISLSSAEPLNRKELPIERLPSRRILRGQAVVGATRPYMVYLRPADPTNADPNWLCGGAIIHAHYVLTSAACIEDVKLFYVVSGTSRYIPLNVTNDLCIKNGAKKAVGKTVPKNYAYDGADFNNIRWMANDIAIVKVDEDFNFEKRIKGCDFIPRPIGFNNESRDLEKPLTEASIAGWGSDDKYTDRTDLNIVNSPVLMEGKVVLISKKNCKKRWAERYHYIIDNYMICARDSAGQEGDMCKGPGCKNTVYDDETPVDITRRQNANVRSSSADVNNTRRTSFAFGGFCENDHGGPLVVGEGVRAVVVGVISACMTKDATQKCYGPFLFTSVLRNSKLISCVLSDESVKNCKDKNDDDSRKAVETHYNWASNSIRSNPEPTEAAGINAEIENKSRTDGIKFITKKKNSTSGY